MSGKGRSFCRVSDWHTVSLSFRIYGFKTFDMASGSNGDVQQIVIDQTCSPRSVVICDILSFLLSIRETGT